MAPKEGDRCIDPPLSSSGCWESGTPHFKTGHSPQEFVTRTGRSGGSGSSTRNTGIDVIFKTGQDAYLGVLMIDDSSSS